MGVRIRTIKPTEYVTEKVAEIIDSCRPIYTLDFSPIKHLTQFKEGYYNYEPYGNAELSIPCSSFNDFRRAVCAPIHGDWDEYCLKVESGEEQSDGAFAEFLYFADNEGCFDYVIAKKLLGDFEKHRNSIYPTLATPYQWCYDSYTQILKECTECKGVVYYS